MLLSAMKYVEIEKNSMVIIKTATSDFGPIPLVSYQLIAILYRNSVFKLVFSVQDEELDQWGVC